METLKNILLVSLPTISILLLILEVIVRTVIPAADPPQSFFNEKEKMFCFSNEKETGTYTIGPFAEIRTRWRINNMGWNYPIDYYPIKNKKLIAIIGDSYIEAFEVDVGKNYAFLLRERLKNDYEVYAFGKSGAPLSQYLHISKYVNRHFDPDVLIFNLVSNDFDESIQELKPHAYCFLQVSISAHDSITETIPRSDPSLAQYTPLKRLVFRSALFRYLYLNLKTKQIVSRLFAISKNREASFSPDDVKRKKRQIIRVTDYLVRTIRQENSNKRVIFVMDAPRNAIYRNTLDKSDVTWMYEMMATICRQNNTEFIDMTPYMREAFESTGKRYETDCDNHWNEYGHEFVADVLYRYLANITH